jgi:Glycosyl hydrolases family 25
MLHGNDVSRYQGADWKPASSDAFVFIKITEGRTVTSPTDAEQLKTARAADLVVGHYHYLHKGNAKEQAAYFVSKLDTKPGDLLVCDWEGDWAAGKHPSVTDAATFIAEVQRLKPGHKVGLYCNRSDWMNTSVKKGDFLWLAHYTVRTDVKGWDFWQYTDKPIDKNWANERWQTKDDLRAWAVQGSAPAPPWTEPTEVHYSKTWKSDYVAFGGSEKWVTPIDKTILIACALASDWGSVRIVQGGRRPRTSYSGSTHMGLGVGDIAIDGRSKAKVWEFCAAMRRSGIRPFPRGYGGDPWENEKHIHFGSRESYDHASESLQAQIREQERGGDGLRGDRPYNGPSYADLGRWKDSPYNPVNIKIDTGEYEVAEDGLNGYTVDKIKKHDRELGYIVKARTQVYRWGRWNVVTSTPTYYKLSSLKPITPEPPAELPAEPPVEPPPEL